MKTSKELLDERLNFQDGHIKGERITISKTIACELMEDYHAQFLQEIELPDDEKIEEIALDTFISIQSQNAFVVGFKYACDKIGIRKNNPLKRITSHKLEYSI